MLANLGQRCVRAEDTFWYQCFIMLFLSSQMHYGLLHGGSAWFAWFASYSSYADFWQKPHILTIECINWGEQLLFWNLLVAICICIDKGFVRFSFAHPSLWTVCVPKGCLPLPGISEENKRLLATELPELVQYAPRIKQIYCNTSVGIEGLRFQTFLNIIWESNWVVFFSRQDHYQVHLVGYCQGWCI